jgi:hypothetical protein
VNDTRDSTGGEKTMKGRGKGSNSTGGSNVVSLGKRLHIICLSRQWDQNYLFIKVIWKDGTLSALSRQWNQILSVYQR